MALSPVRNVAVYLDGIFANLRIIAQLFASLTVAFYCDQSYDGTLQKLQLLARRQQQQQDGSFRVFVLTPPAEENMPVFRTWRIARARNRLMQFAEQQEENFDYMIAFDADDVCAGPMNVDALRDALQQQTHWDCISFNREPYYDTWALLLDPFLHHAYACSDSPYAIVACKTALLTEKLRKCTEKQPFVSVWSAFNGFALYKWPMFAGLRYDGRKQCLFEPALLQTAVDNIEAQFALHGVTAIVADENCEHNVFHVTARQQRNATIVISPNILFARRTDVDATSRKQNLQVKRPNARKQTGPFRV